MLMPSIFIYLCAHYIEVQWIHQRNLHVQENSIASTFILEAVERGLRRQRQPDECVFFLIVIENLRGAYHKEQHADDEQ